MTRYQKSVNNPTRIGPRMEQILRLVHEKPGISKRALAKLVNKDGKSKHCTDSIRRAISYGLVMVPCMSSTGSLYVTEAGREHLGEKT